MPNKTKKCSISENFRIELRYLFRKIQLHLWDQNAPRNGKQQKIIYLSASFFLCLPFGLFFQSPRLFNLSCFCQHRLSLFFFFSKSFLFLLPPKPGFFFGLLERMTDLRFNPLQSNISMHILHTVLYTFSNVRVRRICLTIERSFSW